MLAGVALATKWLSSGEPAIQTVKASRVRIEGSVLATGSLQAVRQVDVGTRVTGQLKSLKAKIGEQVKAGQLLAEIDPVLFENDLRAQKASLAKLEAQREAAEAKIERTRFELRRQKRMIAEATTSSRDVEAAEAQAREEKAALKAVDAEIAQAKALVENASANLAFTKITAPIDGEVVAVLTQEGQTVVAAQIVPVILKLAQLDAMTVRAQISEADVTNVHVGQAAEFSIVGDRKRRFEGRVRLVEPAPQSLSDPATAGTSSSSSSNTSTSGSGAHPAIFYNALFDVPNRERRLRIGMTAQVTIHLGDAREALTVPSGAVHNFGSDDEAFVKVRRGDGRMEKRAVRVGLDDYVRAEILSGLSQGEEVVTEESASKADE